MVIKDSVKIGFAGGLDLKTDPKQISADDFLALNNMVFTTGGRLTLRNGFAGGYTKTVNSPNPALTYSAVPGTLASATKVFSYNDELLLNDSWNLYSWDASASSWSYKGRSTVVGLSTSTIVSDANDYVSCDTSVDTTSGVKIFTYYDFTNSNVYYSLQDTVTGQFIINRAVFGGTPGAPGYGSPRCISISGKSWVFALSLSDGKLYYQAIVGQVVTGSVTALITDLSTDKPYDVDVDTFSGGIYIAYDSATGIKISALSTSMVVGNTITVTGSGGNGVSWFGDGSNIWVIYCNGSATRAFVVNNAVTITVAASTIIDNAVSTTVNNLTGVWSTTFSKAFIFFDNLTQSALITTSAVTYFASATLSGSTISPSSVNIFMATVCLNSKAFSVNGIPHVVCLYNLASTITTIVDGAAVTTTPVPQATNFLLNLYNVTPSMGSSTNNDVIANIAAKISPGEASIVAPYGAISSGIGARGSLAGTHQSHSGEWEVALLQNSNIGLASISSYSPVFAPTGAIDCVFNFNLTNPDVQSLGNNALLAGGQVTMYDGANVVEQNFHIYPNSSTATVSTGVGGVLGLSGSDSLYSYIYTYEWIDNQGQVHRSFPSPVVTPLTSGHIYTFASGTTTGKVQLTIPTLGVTNKSGSQVVINVYRTIANGSIYFLLGTYGTALNNPNSPTVTVNDVGLSDASIQGNLQLYTTGALGYFSPPATSAITNFKNRAIQVGSEDPYQIGYSNAVLQNFPVQFVPEFLQNIGTVGGPLVTVAQMDDKMIFFKSGKINGPAIYYMQGQGPAPSGANNDFQDPLPIAVDAGCVDRPSVVLTPVGLMFKSDKGIYLIDRSLQATYIGAQVEGYNSYSVLSAQLIPNSTQVRFWLSNGTLLMYDYFYKKWATWTPPAGVSDCIFQGQHTYVTAAGQVYQETPGLYVDGTSTPVLWSFTTAWIKLGGLQGYQRAFWLLLLGDYISSHQLSVSLYTDFSAVADSTVTITPNSSDSLENWRVFFKNQRCQSFQVQISQVSTGVLGQGLNLSGLNLVAGFKSKYRTISAAQSTG